MDPAAPEPPQRRGVHRMGHDTVLPGVVDVHAPHADVGVAATLHQWSGVLVGSVRAVHRLPGADAQLLQVDPVVPDVPVEWFVGDAPRGPHQPGHVTTHPEEHGGQPGRPRYRQQGHHVGCQLLQ